MYAPATDRATLVRRGVWLAWFTIAWNSIEGVAGVVAGIAAGREGLEHWRAEELDDCC